VEKLDISRPVRGDCFIICTLEVYLFTCLFSRFECGQQVADRLHQHLLSRLQCEDIQQDTLPDLLVLIDLYYNLPARCPLRKAVAGCVDVLFLF